MGLVLERENVLEVYQEAAERRWVLPTFNTENLTCLEAILSAASEYGRKLGVGNLPICTGLTNQYFHRAQAPLYTHTRRWDIGLRLFMSEVEILAGKDGPFEHLKVMVHLDHTQWDTDAPLLEWDMGQFSSIMYDASTLPFDENIRLTAEFMEKHGQEIVVEGACDEIAEATGDERVELTTPEMAERYDRETGVDIIVANLGTEHRATAATLTYHGDLAREIKRRIGPKLCLHGTSSVPGDQVRRLFDDGVRKVNVWTAFERDSSPALLRDMAENAARVAGPDAAARMARDGLLGPKADVTSKASLEYYTTTYRQQIVFERMKQIATDFLSLWYT